jgi:large subunit ribosomal protein L30
MTDATKTTAKKAPAKKSATTAAKPAVKKTPAAKVVKTTTAKTGATLTVKQIGSPARSEAWVYQTLIGLRLNRLNRISVLEDTPAVRGMINRVHHLVEIQEQKSA